MQYIIAIIFNFNPRSHERSDNILLNMEVLLYDFNPRSHERSDTMSNKELSQLINFNPRSHERSDKYDCIEWMESHISIHAPTRGATSALFL